MARRKGRATSDTVGIAPVQFPVGCVLPFAGTTAPEGWLLCDGSAVNRTTYAALFSVLGSAHGQGDGSTTFHIPDLRGRFIRGVDGAANRDPDKAARTAANAGGNTGNNIGSVQDDALQGHRLHTGSFVGSASGGVDGFYRAGSSVTTFPTTQTFQSDGVNGTPRVSSESRSKNVNLQYIIKV